jgi:hypothetical protein
MLPRSIPVKRGYVSSRLPMRYARAVKRGLRIELPSTRDDELPLRSLVATSFACLALGLAAAYGLADRKAPHAATIEPADRAPSATAGAEEVAPIAKAEPEPAPPVEPPAPAIPEAAPIDRAADAGIASEPAPNEPAPNEPAPSAPPEPARVDEPAAPIVAAADVANDPPQPAEAPQTAGEARRLLVKPGVFAYLRCEGVKQRRGKYPCPRDRGLEVRMRTIIEALPTCREAQAISRGRSFELRLELGSEGTFKELQVKGPNEAAERAVRACAGPALRKERTELKSTRMIVSMRFKAR